MFVYKITNKINPKIYVGITMTSLKARFSSHCCPSSQCTLIGNAIQCHGKENFQIELLEECKSFEEMCQKEIHYIKLLNTKVPNGYNLVDGGNYSGMNENFRKMLDERQVKVIGISIDNGSILRFSNILACENAGYIGVEDAVALRPHRKTIHSKRYIWFRDEDQPDDYFIQEALNLMGCNFGEYSKGRRTWEVCDKPKRLKNMRDASEYRFKSLIRVDLTTFEAKEYENVHDALRDGYSTGAIYNCFNKKFNSKQKNHFFRKDPNLKLEDYINMSKEIINQQVYV